MPRARLLALFMLTSPVAAMSETSAFGAREAQDRAAAERAVADFRRRSFIPTPCERAFRVFWKAFRAPGRKPGDLALIRDPSLLSSDDWFGYGHRASEPLLADAQTVCAAATGARGDLVVRVLERRARAGERRAERRRVVGEHQLRPDLDREEVKAARD
ncbi:MAG: hypothetical protein AAF192_03880 [Pseudomonadota bacterium]